MRTETKEAFDNILNTMTCADGGVAFVKFRSFIEDFDNRASKGDDGAEQLITLMRRFSKMIDVAQREK